MKYSLLILFFLQTSILYTDSSIYIVDEDGRFLADVIGPINEGSHLSLLCETNGGVPSGLSWWKDSLLLDDSFDAMPRGSARNELTLAYVGRSDLMSTLTCQAAMPNVTESAEKSVSLDMNLKPLNVHITSLQRPLSAGRRTTLKCQSVGSRPPATLTWWIGSRQLLNATTATYDSTTISKLALVPTPEDHEKVLSCRATNPVMDGNILEDHRMLNIHHVPVLSVTVGTPRNFIVEDDIVYFDCNIVANPPATEVGWRFNDQTLYTNVNAGIKIQNHSLLLHKISRKFTGNYSCVAANSEGEGVSEGVAIDVHYTPHCSPFQKSSYGVPLRESIQIECSVESNPDPVQFYWYLNNTYRQIPLKSHTMNGSTSTLQFTPKRESDYGHVYCVAENTVGLQKEACCFKVASASVPNAVEDCNVTNETTSTATITCSPGFDGGLPQTFHMELYSTFGLVATQSKDTEPVFEMFDLPSGSNLIAVAFATNSRGRSKAVAFSVVTAAELKPVKSEYRQPITPVIGVLIAVMGSLVATAIAVVVCSNHWSNRLGDGIPQTPTAWDPELLVKPMHHHI